MGFEEFNQRTKMGIKPFFEGVPGGEGQRRGDLSFFKSRFKVRPVHPDPVRSRQRRGGDRVFQPHRDRDMVRPSGGEVSCLFLEQGHQGRGRKCEV